MFPCLCLHAASGLWGKAGERLKGIDTWGQWSFVNSVWEGEREGVNKGSLEGERGNKQVFRHISLLGGGGTVICTIVYFHPYCDMRLRWMTSLPLSKKVSQRWSAVLAEFTCKSCFSTFTICWTHNKYTVHSQEILKYRKSNPTQKPWSFCLLALNTFTYKTSHTIIYSLPSK